MDLTFEEQVYDVYKNGDYGSLLYKLAEHYLDNKERESYIEELEETIEEQAKDIEYLNEEDIRWLMD